MLNQCLNCSRHNPFRIALETYVSRIICRLHLDSLSTNSMCDPMKMHYHFSRSLKGTDDIPCRLIHIVLIVKASALTNDSHIRINTFLLMLLHPFYFYIHLLRVLMVMYPYNYHWRADRHILVKILVDYFIGPLIIKGDCLHVIHCLDVCLCISWFSSYSQTCMCVFTPDWHACILHFELYYFSI